MNCQAFFTQLQTLKKEVVTLRSLIRDQRIIEHPRGLGSEEREVKRAQWMKEREVLERTNEAVKKMHDKIENMHKKTLFSFRKYLALVLLKKRSKELIKLSEKNEIMYHSPDALKERLEKLSGGVISISEEEIERMYKVHPEQITKEQKLHLKKMKQYSITKKGEGVESAPIVMVIPQKIVINKKEIPLSIRTLEDNLWPSLKTSEQWKLHMKEKLKGLYVGKKSMIDKPGNPLGNLMDKQWGTHLLAFTSVPIKGSYQKDYEEQKLLVKELFGSNSEIRADMYLSMVFHYLLTEKLLINWNREGVMRLHEISTDGFPLDVYYYGGDPTLNLWFLDTQARNEAGIGSSFVFPLPSFAEASEGKPST